MQITATFYDGRRSKPHTVFLQLVDGELLIRGDGIDLRSPLSKVRITAPLGSMQRSIYLPDGGKCDFADEQFARRAEQLQGKGGFFGFVHHWENSLKLAFTALFLTVILVVAFIQYGIPLLAERAAYAVPPEAELSLGRETLVILDKTMLEPTALDEGRQQQLVELFATVVANLDATERPYRIELRSSPKVGANAFALPGGTVIMTDELIAIAGSQEEIAAVLAHEVGHVQRRHAMRQLIQGSAVGLIVASLTGDISSITSMAAALPTMLVDAKFSRDMEREADDVAVAYLRARGESVEHFANILTALEEAFNKKYGRDEGATRSSHYFSSHPATAERIVRLREVL